MNNDEQYVDDCCDNCKSFSSPNRQYRSKKGFCMKWRKSVKRTDVCGYHRPDVKVEYQMECKPPERSSAPPKNHFSN